MRFITVALFCTQAAANQRPTMKQVVEMLSREVHLNEKLLTEPGVYKGHKTRKLNGAGTSSEGTSFSHGDRGKKAMKSTISSPQFNSSNSLTQMLPR